MTVVLSWTDGYKYRAAMDDRDKKWSYVGDGVSGRRSTIVEHCASCTSRRDPASLCAVDALLRSSSRVWPVWLCRETGCPRPLSAAPPGGRGVGRGGWEPAGASAGAMSEPRLCAMREGRALHDHTKGRRASANSPLSRIRRRARLACSGREHFCAACER